MLLASAVLAAPLQAQPESAPSPAASTAPAPDARAHPADQPIPAFEGEPAAERVARARSHFVLGMQFFETRAFRDSIREFQLAVALVPSAEIWFNIGRAHEELGEYERARGAFERYLRDRVDAPDAAAVRERLQAMAARAREQARGLASGGGSGSLRIHAPPLQAVVALDGRVITSPLTGPIMLSAGRHRLEVTRPGFIPFRAELSIEPGMLTSAYPRLAPLTAPPRPEPERGRTWTWVALGLAGAGAIGSGVLGAVSLDQQAGGRADSARTWSKRADLTLAGTSVCALAAALLYFIEAPSESSRTSTSALAGGHARR